MPMGANFSVLAMMLKRSDLGFWHFALINRDCRSCYQPSASGSKSSMMSCRLRFRPATLTDSAPFCGLATLRSRCSQLWGWDPCFSNAIPGRLPGLGVMAVSA